MIGHQLSKHDDHELHRALESVLRTRFPNPERNDCPGTETLRAIAAKRISMRDPAVDHVGHCSPCFDELTSLRTVMSRRAIIWKTSGAAAAIVLLALLVSEFWLQENSSRTPVPTQRAAVTLDLRNASTARSIQPAGATRLTNIEIPRAILSLTVQLPIGSEGGSYEVAIRKPDQSAGSLRTTGIAQIDSGITILEVDLDTSSLPEGDYDLAWRLADFDWRSYPIHIR